jgi:hypothetical protein
MRTGWRVQTPTTQEKAESEKVRYIWVRPDLTTHKRRQAESEKVRYGLDQASRPLPHTREGREREGEVWRTQWRPDPNNTHKRRQREK